MKKDKILKYLKKPSLLLSRWRMKNLRRKANSLSDEEFIKRAFRIRCGYKLDLDNPRTYNEKLQWLKLYNRDPFLHQLADKYLVREYVEKRIGKQYLIPLLKVWDNPDDVDFSALPKAFVIKCNHNSGLGMIICKNKDNLNFEETRLSIDKGFKEDYFVVGREWAYKNITKKIICEEFISEEDGSEPNDYKFFCFDGKFKFLLVCSDRHTNLSNDWYDENLNHLPCTNGAKNNKRPITLPNNIKEMIAVSEKLAEGLTHVRVDLYSLGGRILFGEMTFYESSGFAPFKPKKYDYLFGSYLHLPKKKEYED